MVYHSEHICKSMRIYVRYMCNIGRYSVRIAHIYVLYVRQHRHIMLYVRIVWYYPAILPKSRDYMSLVWYYRPKSPDLGFWNGGTRYQDFRVLTIWISKSDTKISGYYFQKCRISGLLLVWYIISDIQISEFWASEPQIQILRSEGYTKPFRHKRAKTGFVKSNSSASSIGVLATEMAVFVSTPDLKVFTTALGSSARPMQEER